VAARNEDLVDACERRVVEREDLEAERSAALVEVHEQRWRGLLRSLHLRTRALEPQYAANGRPFRNVTSSVVAFMSPHHFTPSPCHHGDALEVEPDRDITSCERGEAAAEA